VPKDAGLRQLDVFESVGVKPQRVAIGHTCCLDDPTADIIKQIAKRGAFVGFDRVTGGMVPDDKKVINRSDPRAFAVKWGDLWRASAVVAAHGEGVLALLNRTIGAPDDPRGFG
jgi:Phosphotriesterase family